MIAVIETSAAERTEALDAMPDSARRLIADTLQSVVSEMLAELDAGAKAGRLSTADDVRACLKVAASRI